MTRVLLIGSHNRDKAAELRELLRDSAWDVRSIDDFGPVDEPEETEDSFEGNALLKARYYGEKFGVCCVADDSGIEVDALEGGPGVLSARYAGDVCTYADNNEKMLHALNGVPEKDRGARFVCCAAFADTNGDSFVETGCVEGRIASECRGENGFGYDPLFIPEGYNLTFGELNPEEKRAVSHRGRAFRNLSDRLQALV